MKSVIIMVKDIHCESCENTICTALQKIPGVVHVVSSAERNEVSIGYDATKTGEDDLREKLADLGYESTVSFKVSGSDGPHPSSPQGLQVESNDPRQRESQRTLYSKFAGGAGLIGGISCTVSMILLVLGLLGTVTAQASNSRESMAGMGATSEGPGLINLVLAFLIARGPIILVISIVLVAFAVSLRQHWLAIPALAAGALLYWGMYVQRSATLMYFASGFGIVVWLLLFFTSMRTAMS